jgi:hypothetical protein
MNKKVQKLLEELGSQAAKPSATQHREGTALKLSFNNSKVYPASEHEQAEEVQEVIIESALTEFLVKEMDHYLELEGSVDEVLNEGIGNFLKWKLLKYSVKFIEEDSLDEIIEASGSELPASKILKIKKVRNIMEKVPNEERNRFYQNSALQKAESLYSKGKAAKTVGGVGTVAGGVGFGAGLAASMSKTKEYEAVMDSPKGFFDYLWKGEASDAMKLKNQADMLANLGMAAGAVAIAGLIAFGIGAVISSRVKKNIRVDVSEVKEYLGSKKQDLKESYTREDLEVLFESLNLDTHKYTFEYLAEELGFAAAKPVHGSGEAKEHTPKFTNSDIYPASHHEQAEEVEEVIVESYSREDLEELFESLELDTDKYTFEYLAEELGFIQESSSSKKADKAREDVEKDIEKSKLGTEKGLKSENKIAKNVATYQKNDAGKTAGTLISKARETENRKEKNKLYDDAKKLIKIGKDSKKTIKHPFLNTTGKYILKAGAGTAAGLAGAGLAGVPSGLGFAGYGAGVGAGFGGGAKDLVKHTNRKDVGYNKKISNISKKHNLDEEYYTQEDLEQLFEALELDTDKYTFEYLAEELGFEQK